MKPLLLAAALAIVWGAFALKLAAPLALGLLLGALLFGAAFARTLKIDRLGVLILLNYAYWLCSGLATRAINARTFVTAEFWSGEGRVFLMYFPLIVYAVLQVDVAHLRTLVRHLKYVAAAGLAMFCAWLATQSAYLSEGHRTIFFGLQTSHTGAGMFWGAMFVFLVSFGGLARSRQALIAGLVCLPIVIGTASREALLAAMLTLAAWSLKSRNVRRKLGYVLIVMLGLAILPLASPRLAERIASVANRATLIELSSSLFSSTDFAPQRGQADDPSVFNAQMRIYLWKDAFDKFCHSPLFGIGFARFNDDELRYRGIDHLAFFAVEGTRNYGSEIEFGSHSDLDSLGNAHNSYLQLLAESGVVGLVLLLSVWGVCWRRLGRMKAAAAAEDQPFCSAYAEAARNVIVFSLIGSLFGHQLASPTQGLLVMVLIGAGVSLARARRGQRELSLLLDPV